MEFSLTVQQLYERVLQDPQVELHLQRLEEYHHESYEHLLRVGRLTIYLGDKTGLASADILKAGYAGILHDVGKIGIPHCVLTKPEKLTPDERRIMRSHARLGFLHLQDLEPPEIARIVVAHHEFQPEGYPRATSRRSYERRHLETQAAIEQRTRRDRRQQERREDNGKISTLAQLDRK